VPREPLYVAGMWGMGDNIYSRPFVRAAAQRYDIWLDTPWPEIYADVNIKFVRGTRRLRTQLKNIKRQEAERWSMPPNASVRQIKIGYGIDLHARSIIDSMQQHWWNAGIHFDPALFDLPDMGPSPVISDRPVAVVRPVTVRQEWRNEARNPRPEYIAQLAAALMATHHVVSVADIAPNEEWAIGELPQAHQHFLFGELSVHQLLALIRDADIVIGGVGWIVPAGLALKVKTFVVLGGHGGHNAPAKITDPRLDLSRLGFAVPEKFCQCTRMLHDSCDKKIADPLGQFSHWLGNLRVAA
jgi:ADP-heptose:LPS heptosyltransferase